MDLRTPDTSTVFSDLNAAALMRGGVHPGRTGLTGRGVVLCLIDYGFDLLHPSLRCADGSTRFAYLIDQNGTRLDRVAIDRLIEAAEAADDRAPLDEIYDPHAHYFGQDGVVVGAHGSWVASIAAGTRSDRFTGVAPEATLIGVQLALPDTAWRETGFKRLLADGACASADRSRWQSYDESDAIVDALHDGYEVARKLGADGVVFNLSIGAWAGGHHPGARVNQALARLAARGGDVAAPMTFVVAGTGNAGADEGHFQATLAPGRGETFTWHLHAGAAMPEKLEVWSDQPVEVIIRLCDPNAEVAPLRLTDDGGGVKRLMLGENLIAIGEREAGRHGCLTCLHLLATPVRAGGSGGSQEIAFTLEVSAGPGNRRPAEVHAWVERTCSGPASRLVPATRTTTLTSLATAPAVISVAGLDAGDDGAAALALSGRGPAPWANAGCAISDAPALAAPGAGIWGARSKTTGFMRGSGTSAATAIVSGAVAVAIEAATAQRRRLGRDELVDILIGGRRGRWSPETGWGALAFSTAGLASQTRSHHRGSGPLSPLPDHQLTVIAEGDRAR